MIVALSIVSVVLIVVGFLWFKLWKASREIDHLLKVNSGLQGQVQQQKVEIKRKEMELSNAQVKRKNDESVKRVSGDAVDEQLHAKGYFRDDGVGVSGVQPDLSKSCGHDGNEAADSGS